MRDNLAKFAPAVFWAGVIVLLLGVVVLASGVTAGSGRGPVPTEYMLIGGLVLMLLSALMRPEMLRRALGVRSVRYGSNALVLTLAFVAILGLINYLGTQPRFNWRQDFTSNKQFTLSPQTIQILESLKQPVKATAFIGLDPSTGQSPFNAQEIKDRLREYALHSANFSYDIVDPFQHPELVQQFEVSFNGSVVFQAGTKKQEAAGSSESDFTGALVKITSDKPRVVYFLSGHRERDPNDSGEGGYSTVRAALEKDNYSIATQSLQITSTIPVSATALVLSGARQALTNDEVKVLDTYLAQGGRLLVMVDPGQPDPIPGLLVKWGVKFDDDQVVDPQFVQGTSALFPAVQQYPSNPITQKLNGLLTVVPLVRSVQRVDPAPANLTIQSVIQSSSQSWGETILDFQNNPPRYDEGKDLKGPLNMAVSIEGSAPISTTTGTTPSDSPRKTRIVVIGTTELVSNRMLTLLRGAGNTDVFLNAINWLAEEEALISIRPIPPDQRLLTMTSGQVQTVFLLTVIVLPALVLLTGASVWWKRR